jgi:hypothetical protein
MRLFKNPRTRVKPGKVTETNSSCVVMRHVLIQEAAIATLQKNKKRSSNYSYLVNVP